MAFKTDAIASEIISSGTVLAIGSIPDPSMLYCSGGGILGLELTAAGSFATTVGGVPVASVGPWACAQTNVVGDALVNTTAATPGAVKQYSPIRSLGGSAYASGAAASVLHEWGMQVQPAQAGAATVSAMHFLQRTDGGSWTSRFNVDSTGLLTTTNYVSAAYYTCTGGIFMYNGDRSTGLGTCGGVDYNTAASPIAVVHRGRTNAANNIGVALCTKIADTFANINERMIAAHVSFSDSTNANFPLVKVYKKHVMLPTFTVATAPASPVAGEFGICTDGDAGAPCMAVCDGAGHWLRIALGAAISAT